MKYISHVRSNVKGGVDCDLFPKTLLVGRRGTGKSAVVNSIELTIDGRASNIAGRDVSREVELLSLGPPTEDLVATVHFAEVTNGDVSPAGAADFHVARTATGAKKAVRHTPANVDDRTLVLRPVMGALLGSPETARKFLLAHAGGTPVTTADVQALIPAALQDYYQRALVTCTPHLAPTDGLLEVLATAAQAAREAVKRGRAAGAVLESAAQGVAEQPTAAALRDATEVLASARAAFDAASRAEAAAVATEAQRQELEQRLADASSRLAAADEQRASIVAEVRQLPPEAEQPPDPVLVALLAALEVNLAQSPAECLCCGAPTSSGALTARRDAIHTATARTMALNAAFQALNVRYEAVLAEWRRRMEDQTRAKTALAQLTSSAPPTDSEPLRTAALKAEARHTALQRAAAAWETLDRARDEQRAAEQEATAWKALVEACAKAVGQLVDVHVDAFVARVQRHLPAGWTFALHLRDGERETFRIGLVRDGWTVTALSGGEWATLTAAMAAACVSEETDLSVLIPEDCSIDAESLTEVLTAFSECASQVIVTSAVAPTSVPAGWHVIDTDRGEHRATSAVTTVTAAAKKTRGKRKVA